MTLWVDVTVRSSILLSLVLAACACLRHRSAALRHTVLAVGILAAGAAGPLAAIVPSVVGPSSGWNWTVALPSSVLPVEGALTSPAPGAAGGGLATPARNAAASRSHGPHTASLSRAAPLVWGVGLWFGFALLVGRLIRLNRLTASASAVTDERWTAPCRQLATRCGIHHPVMLLRTDRHDVLATWGLAAPCVILPRHALSWSDDRIRSVLCHELAHIQRRDWPVQMAADVVRILLWFNPLAWVAVGRLRRESERACDDVVLRLGVPPETYARHLVDIVRSCRRAAPRAAAAALSLARPSSLEWRITAMLNATLDRRPATQSTRIAVGLILALVLLPAIGLRVSAQAPGSLVGLVYDRTGAVLPGAEVTLTSGTQPARSAITDGRGRFEFTNAAASDYTVKIVLPGFRSVQHAFTLAPRSGWSRAFTLQVGELQETISVTGRRRPRDGAPAQAPPVSDRVRVGGSIRPPRKLKDVTPVYPDSLQEAGVEGVVRIDALIGTDGHVVSVRTLGAQVHPDLARAAEEAVRQWEFSPTLLNNEPVEVEMAVSVQFSLAD